MRVAPLDPRAVGGITGAVDAADGFDRHLVVGGLPLLAASWPAGASLRSFLEGALGDDQTPFATTALRVLASEFRRDLQAERVLRAIGHGETAHGRIADRSGLSGNTLTAALDVLVNAKGLVARTLPYAVPPSKQPARYVIVDAYLRFWMRFVGPHLDELSRGRSDLVIARIERDWPAYRGRAVEPVVRRSARAAARLRGAVRVARRRPPCRLVVEARPQHRGRPRGRRRPRPAGDRLRRLGQVARAERVRRAGGTYAGARARRGPRRHGCSRSRGAAWRVT